MSIFEYEDYRNYLKDFYEAQKAKNPHFSFRSFAQKAKLTSPNYLKLVIDRKRRITDKNLNHFIRGLGLKAAEAAYFTNLIFYQEAKSKEAKETYLSELMRIRNREMRAAKLLTEEQHAQVLGDWVNWAVREMVLLKDFRPDPYWISERLQGLVSAEKAQQSLDLLQSLELIEEQNGKFAQRDLLVTTSDEKKSVVIQGFHRQFTQLSLRSLAVDSVKIREFSGLTIALPKSRIPEIKGEIKEFRKKLNKIFSQEQENDDVYHLTINFFPITRIKENDKCEG